jgi:lipocalin
MIEAPNGEARLLIVGTALGAALERSYPAASYVGLWFHIAKLPNRSGKRYAEYEVLEIEPPAMTAAAA